MNSLISSSYAIFKSFSDEENGDEVIEYALLALMLGFASIAGIQGLAVGAMDLLKVLAKSLSFGSGTFG